MCLIFLFSVHTSTQIPILFFMPMCTHLLLHMSVHVGLYINTRAFVGLHAYDRQALSRVQTQINDLGRKGSEKEVHVVYRNTKSKLLLLHTCEGPQSIELVWMD